MRRLHSIIQDQTPPVSSRPFSQFAKKSDNGQTNGSIVPEEDNLMNGRSCSPVSTVDAAAEGLKESLASKC